MKTRDEENERLREALEKSRAAMERSMAAQLDDFRVEIAACDAALAPAAPVAEATVGIYRCPQHPSFWAVVVDDVRITPSECCGRWDLVKEWKKVNLE